jgi:hypothetical protein
MGCDIHMYVEKKVKNEWKVVKGPNSYYGKYEWEKDKMRFDWIYNGRNYDLFAFLADVRNYKGKIKPLALPKELPEDKSEFVAQIAEGWQWDGHSYSHFTLKELKESKPKDDEVREVITVITKLLQDVQEEDSEEDIRIVFWFDN